MAGAERPGGDGDSDLERIIEVVAFQADACATSGSPLYGRLLEGVGEDLRAGGVTRALLCGRPEEPFASALVLRFLGAVHRVVLDGRAPELAEHYPSVGGTLDGDPVPAFLATVRRHLAEVRRRSEDGVQTNEVGRSAALVGGYATVARRSLLPLRVLEVGASAGLNLRWDHYAYDTGRGRPSGDPDSPVVFAGMWEGEPPELPDAFEVAERRGCDRHPIDATTARGRATLRSYVWPDQVDRLRRLDAAIEVARRVPAAVDEADAASWIADRLRAPTPGLATVVVHSIVLQYLDRPGRARFREAVNEAGARATGSAPLAWLRLEPGGERAEIRLTIWPHGDEVVLGSSGYHGQPVWWGASA
jgi:hypothetical protein